MDAPRLYADNWTDYRNRMHWLWFSVLAGPLLVFAFSIPLSSLFSSEVPFAIFGVSWMVATTVCNFRTVFWPCPRCHKPFFRGWFIHRFTKQCVHCGLPKWSLGPERTQGLTVRSGERRRSVHPFSARAFGRRR